jgi:hypothetical protein
MRVVVLGDLAVAAEWRADAGADAGANGDCDRDDLVDIRLHERARMWPAEFPTTALPRLFELHRALRLTFGVYDFKIDGKERPIFLEVNSAGQWLDVEVGTGYPLSEAWARVLGEGIGTECNAHGPAFTDAELDRLMLSAADASLE